MTLFIEVSIHSKIPKNLIYKLNNNFQKISIGSLIFVKVKNKIYPGFVVKIHSTNPTSLSDEKIEEVYSISPYPPFFDEKQLSFYQFASYYYLTPLSTVLSNAFPNLGYYKIKESLEVSDCYEFFQKKEEIFFSFSKKKNFYYMDEDITTPIEPTDEQSKIIELIQKSKNSSKTFLLSGRTGTGKTALLLLLAKKLYDEGKSTLFMIPEIGLAPHIYRRALSIFPKEDVLIWHSGLTNSERRFVFETTKNKRVLLIGTRSSIFLPLKDLGIILIDEEQDSSYKSDTSFPYNSRDLAFVLSKIYKIPLVLSSATPSIETYFKVQNGQIELLTLSKRIFEEKKDIIIINTRESEMVNPFLSKRLVQEIEKNLQNGEQSLLFINRRGYIPYVYCNDCKKFIECKNCTVPLTFHKSKNLLICHHCKKSIKPINTCPSCGSKNISYFGAGTERISEMIKNLFPHANVIKIDSDSIEKRDFFKKHLKGLIEGEYNIIVGTQIITKGIHLPKLTLVGIILGEQGLSIPDFRSQERIFQIITQVTGRSGRERKGRVLIQSSIPELPVFKFALNDDYEDFYNSEIQSRRIANFPPFIRLLVIKIRGRDESKTKDFASQIFFKLKRNNKGEQIIIYPPIEAPIYKEKGEYRFQIYLKSEKPNYLIKAIEKLKKDLKTQSGIKVIFDIDPYNLL